MDFTDFLKTTNAGGELLARLAWERAADIAKAAAPDRADALTAAFAPNPAPIEVAAGDSGAATEKGA